MPPLRRQQKIPFIFKNQQYANRCRQQKQQASNNKYRILHARLVFRKQRLQIEQNHTRKDRQNRRNVGKIAHTNPAEAGVQEREGKTAYTLSLIHI